MPPREILGHFKSHLHLHKSLMLAPHRHHLVPLLSAVSLEAEGCLLHLSAAPLEPWVASHAHSRCSAGTEANEGMADSGLGKGVDMKGPENRSGWYPGQVFANASDTTVSPLKRAWLFGSFICPCRFPGFFSPGVMVMAGQARSCTVEAQRGAPQEGLLSTKSRISKW